MMSAELNLGDILNLFVYKSDYLVYTEGYDEISLDSFLELIFTNDNLDMPFETKLCEEYVRWRDSTEEGGKYIEGQPYRYNALILHETPKRNGNGTFNAFSLLLRDDKFMGIRGNRFAIMSPLTYVGDRANYKNARFLYALAFDLDGVEENQISDLFHQIDHKDIRIRLPRPNIIVNSGHGLHLYYLLDKPIPMYRKNIELMNKLKHGLTYRIWNRYTSTCKTRQIQGIVQGFRLPESLTKFGKPVRAFYDMSVHRWSVDTLNEYNLIAQYKLSEEEVKTITDKTRNPESLTLEQAKKLYPDWYESRILQGDKTVKRWHQNKGLYRWWYNRITNSEKGEVKEGHRYYCLMVLSVLARKCDVSFEKLQEDALSLVPFLDSITQHEHFSEDDAESAMQAYYKDYSRLSVDTIERLTDMRIKRCRRNGRTQEEHVLLMNLVRDNITHPDGGWREGNGRPKGAIVSSSDSPQYAKVQEWRKKNPDSTNKSLCARETGLSRPTVRKWWESR